jgi:hypothetical protein
MWIAGIGLDNTYINKECAYMNEITKNSSQELSVTTHFKIQEAH